MAISGVERNRYPKGNRKNNRKSLKKNHALQNILINKNVIFVVLSF